MPRCLICLPCHTACPRAARRATLPPQCCLPVHCLPYCSACQLPPAAMPAAMSAAKPPRSLPARVPTRCSSPGYLLLLPCHTASRRNIPRLDDERTACPPAAMRATLLPRSPSSEKYLHGGLRGCRSAGRNAALAPGRPPHCPVRWSLPHVLRVEQADHAGPLPATVPPATIRASSLPRSPGKLENTCAACLPQCISNSRASSSFPGALEATARTACRAGGSCWSFACHSAPRCPPPRCPCPACLPHCLLTKSWNKKV